MALGLPAVRAQTPPGGPGDSVAIAAARVAALAWLALADAGKYEATWDSSAALFRQSLTKTQWVAAVGQARGPFDPLGARTLATSEYARDLPNAPPGEYVILTFRTGAAAGRTVVQTVIPMKDPDGRWRVSGYFIRPQ